MGESKVKFGDKIFLYGQYLSSLESFDRYEYNSVMGYMTVGGYEVYPKETDEFSAAIPGFVADFSLDAQLAVAPPFNQVEMVEVTDRLSLLPPLLAGCKVWMPTSVLPQERY